MRQKRTLQIPAIVLILLVQLSIQTGPNVGDEGAISYDTR